MTSQIIKKPAKTPSPKLAVPGVNAPLSGYTTFDRKAEEMKIFLSLNPIPEEFLKKK